MRLGLGAAYGQARAWDIPCFDVGCNNISENSHNLFCTRNIAQIQKFSGGGVGERPISN